MYLVLRWILFNDEEILEEKLFSEEKILFNEEEKLFSDE